MGKLGRKLVQVSIPTLCLLGQPKKAVGHESQIGPWCVLSSALIRRVKVPLVLG